jgi:hypothetical protein
MVLNRQRRGFGFDPEQAREKILNMGRKGKDEAGRGLGVQSARVLSRCAQGFGKVRLDIFKPANKCQIDLFQARSFVKVLEF